MRNGATTPVAIIFEPSGSVRINGYASRSYSSEANGNRQMNTTPTTITMRSSRSRSSIKWEMKVSSVMCEA